jgi:hypothetical protein
LYFLSNEINLLFVLHSACTDETRSLDGNWPGNKNLPFPLLIRSAWFFFFWDEFPPERRIFRKCVTKEHVYFRNI